jgi:hypothetical protein
MKGITLNVWQDTACDTQMTAGQNTVSLSRHVQSKHYIRAAASCTFCFELSSWQQWIHNTSINHRWISAHPSIVIWTTTGNKRTHPWELRSYYTVNVCLQSTY